MPSLTPAIIASILGIVGSVLVVTIAPLFTWRTFRPQRLFERKMQVYEQVFGEIHQIRHTADIRRDEIRKGKEGPDSEATRKEFNDARERMMKLAASTAYLLPDDFLRAVRKINTMIFAGDESVVNRYYNNAVAATNEGDADLVRVARADLGIRRSKRLLDRFKLPRS